MLQPGVATICWQSVEEEEEVVVVVVVEEEEERDAPQQRVPSLSYVHTGRVAVLARMADSRVLYITLLHSR